MFLVSIMVAVVYTTIDDIKDARRIAHTLVEEQLVACVNIIPGVESVYRWKGKIEDSKEFVLICKTVDKNVKKLFNVSKLFTNMNYLR